MRLACLIACVATATFAGSAAASPSPVRVDRDHGVRFNLTGSTLTVGLVPQPDRSPRDARRKLWGKRIRAVCSPTFSFRSAPRSVRAVARWPRGQMELSFSFERDIADRVKWCLLEEASGGDIAAIDFAVFIRVYAAGAANRRIGQELRRYLLRNAGSAPWLRQVVGIVVDRGVITVSTQLSRNRRGKRIARRICRLIQGADVADFTPGHTVFGRNDVAIRACPARTDVPRPSTSRPWRAGRGADRHRVLPIPRAGDHLRAGRQGARALSYREFRGDDLGEQFPVRDGELMTAALAQFNSRSHRDDVMEKVMRDPRVTELVEREPLTDMSQMRYGGFQTFVSP